MGIDKKTSTGVHAVNGIVNFITKKGLHRDDLSKVLNDYCSEELGVKGYPTDKETEQIIIAESIQKDFGKFVTWFKKNYK